MSIFIKIVKINEKLKIDILCFCIFFYINIDIYIKRYIFYKLIKKKFILDNFNFV